MKFKKILAGVLASALTMTAGIIPQITANAEEDLKYGDYLFYVKVDEDEDGTYDYVEITDCDESAVEVEIPSKIDDLPVTAIGYEAFSDCTSLSSITIPNSVTTIDRGAFSRCTSLSSVTIPDSVTSIVGDAFFYCTSLESIAIPDSVTSIGYEAFAKCTSLASITIPDSVTSIANYAFEECKSLESITIPDSVTEIGVSAFYGTALLDNQTGVKYADTWVVDCDEDITAVEIKEGTKGISNGAFSWCSNLSSVTIPDSVTEIGVSAFYGTALLDNQTGVKYADTWVVDCDEDITSAVEIKEGTKGIGDEAFFKCGSLSSLTIPDSVTSIGDYAFYMCESLESIDVTENNDYYSSIDGVLFNKDKTEIIKYPARNKNTTYTIPDSVTKIDDSAFDNCTSLKSVTIPDSVTSIGDNAFYMCESLESITIPNLVASIGEGTFSYCTSLESVRIMNPDCKIYGSKYNCTITFGCTIYGYENSTAQAYAKKFGYFGYKFESLGEYTPGWSAADIIALQNFLVKKTDSIGKNYDLNNDGMLNVFDLVILKRKVIYG